MLNARTIAVWVAVISSAALAQGRGDGERHGPPQEAVTACSGLADGTACAFTHHGNNLTGTCRTGPNKEAAACFPAGGHHHGPPPQQAIDACKSLTSGATCTVTFGDQTKSGTCESGPSNELACRPADGGHGGHHGPPPEAIDACKSVAVGAACSVTFKDKTMTGTCREGREGGVAACRPNGPPPGE